LVETQAVETNRLQVNKNFLKDGGLDTPLHEHSGHSTTRENENAMHVAETVNGGFIFLAPWLVFAPVIGLLFNLILEND